MNRETNRQLRVADRADSTRRDSIMQSPQISENYDRRYLNTLFGKELVRLISTDAGSLVGILDILSPNIAESSRIDPGARVRFSLRTQALRHQPQRRRRSRLWISWDDNHDDIVENWGERLPFLHLRWRWEINSYSHGNIASII